MPRKLLIRTSQFPYHITTRSNNREWFDIPLEEVWPLCLESLKAAHSKHRVNLINFVLMSNHYHMMVTTPDENIDKFMYELNKKFSQLLRIKTDRVNRMFSGRYRWCVIKSSRYLMNCYRYVYQNPVRAGLAHRCEFYPYSTLYYQISNRSFPLPLHDKYGWKDNFGLDWLNRPINEEEKLALQNGLKRPEMNRLLHPKTRSLLSFEKFDAI